MKLKIANSEQNFFKGYRNVLFTDLESVYNSSAFEVYCDEHVLKLIPQDNFQSWIKNVCSKIRHGGNIIIVGPDTHNICLQYINGEMDSNSFSNLFSDSKGFYTCKTVKESLLENGLKIHSMSISNNLFIVKAFRE